MNGMSFGRYVPESMIEWHGLKISVIKENKERRRMIEISKGKAFLEKTVPLNQNSLRITLEPMLRIDDICVASHGGKFMSNC